MARTASTWQEYDGSYVAVPWLEGRNVLIRGTSKYLNFGSISGESGYGFRDNGGTMQVKNSGGSWANFGAGGSSAWGSITGTLSDQTDLQTALDGKQAIPVVISGSLTAANDTNYINVASATYTDPTPAEGKGFTVFVRNGTATVGGIGYAVAGTVIRRVYHSGAWANYVNLPVSDTAYASGWNGDTGTAPSKNAVYDEMELRAPKANPIFTGTVTLEDIALDATPNVDHSASGPTTSTINAGATIAIGELVYLASDGEWALADADASSTTEKLLAIALASGTDGNSMKVALPGAFVRDDSWTWTVGGAIYASTTAGAMSQTAPSATDDVVRVVGYAVSADVMYFMPQQGVVHV